MEREVQRWVDKERAWLAKMAWEVTEKDPVKSELGKIDPTALRTLLSAFLRVSCLEEARIVLRYQQGRDRDKWPKPVVEAIEKAMDSVEKKVKERPDLEPRRDQAHVAALSSWLSFVVQLHRFHHTAQRETRAPQARSSHVR